MKDIQPKEDDNRGNYKFIHRVLLEDFASKTTRFTLDPRKEIMVGPSIVQGLSASSFTIVINQHQGAGLCRANK